MTILQVLIIAHETHKQMAEGLREEFERQSEQGGYHGLVDVQMLVNNGSRTRGWYRNKLLNDSGESEYVVFFDADDEPSNDYVEKVMHKILAFGPDVIGIAGQITENGINARRFEHSIKYINWGEIGRTYVRNPNHLNPIKKSIALKVGYKDIDHGEDLDYSTRLMRSRKIKTEKMIDEVIYYYRYNSKKTY